MPPSTKRVAPTTSSGSSPASHTAAVAMSSGEPSGRLRLSQVLLLIGVNGAWGNGIHPDPLGRNLLGRTAQH